MYFQINTECLALGTVYLILDGEAVLLALHSLPHSVVEVVVARLDHLGYQRPLW